ncbi:MAG: ATP-grasp domain-containing protein [Candidatus Andersenbacteria bacterium]
MKQPSSRHWASVGFLFRAAQKFGVTINVLDEERHVVEFQKNSKKILVLDDVPNLNRLVSARLVRDKALVKRVLRQHGVSVPPGIKETRVTRALELVGHGILKFPLVVKPVEGSQGSAVFVGVTDTKWLATAIEEVFKYNRRTKGKSNSFIVEEFVPGDDYRLLVLDGKVLTVVMRKPAYVIGDGVLSIGRLIDQYNQQPEVGKYQPLCPIVRDLELQRHLHEQHLTEKLVPPKGKRIVLRKNANVSTGGRSFECADKVHPEYKKMAVRLARIFGLRFCGIDLIARDISKFSNYAVIEINETPGFDIHEQPYRGRPFPVAEHLVRAMFSMPS